MNDQEKIDWVERQIKASLNLKFFNGMCSYCNKEKIKRIRIWLKKQVGEDPYLLQGVNTTDFRQVDYVSCIYDCGCKGEKVQSYLTLQINAT